MKNLSNLSFATLGICFLTIVLQHNLKAQQYYDSGQQDRSIGLQYDSVAKNFFFHTFQTTGLYDLNVVKQRVNLDSNLSYNNVVGFTAPLNLQSNGRILAIEAVPDAFINETIDFSTVLNSRLPRKLELVKYKNDSLIQKTTLGLDTLGYDGQVALQHRSGDTAYFLITWLDSTSQGIVTKTAYERYCLSTGIKSSSILPEIKTITRYISDSVTVGYGKAALKLPNNDWLIIAGLYNETAQTLSQYVLQTSHDLLTIKNSWPINYSTAVTKIFRENKQIYILSSSENYLSGQGKVDYKIETFDYTQDTLVDGYFYELQITSQIFDDFFNTAYFDGKHFVISGTGDFDPTIPNQFRMELFTVDLNFNIVNRFVYSDSSAAFDSYIYSLTAHPTDSSKLLYSGYIVEPTRNNTYDLIWGEYNIVNNVSLPEGPVFRKARIHLFPNPSSGEIQLLYPSEDFKPYGIEIYNVEGKVVYKETINAARQSLNLNLPAGAYTLYHKSGEHYEYHKLIIE